MLAGQVIPAEGSTNELKAAAPVLLGYVLTTKESNTVKEAIHSLQDRCLSTGARLEGCEFDVGTACNCYRVGLWRALRKLACLRCEPRRMPLFFIDFDDFVYQALKPCICRSNGGADGLIVAALDQISSDQNNGSGLIRALAIRGKHLLAADNTCLSCCQKTAAKLPEAQ